MVCGPPVPLGHEADHKTGLPTVGAGAIKPPVASQVIDDATPARAEGANLTVHERLERNPENGIGIQHNDYRHSPQVICNDGQLADIRQPVGARPRVVGAVVDVGLVVAALAISPTSTGAEVDAST